MALAAVTCLAGCQEPKPAGRAEEAVVPEPAVPRMEALDRAAILNAVARAASAYAAGNKDLGEQRKLDGRQFQFRMRFGCDGPSSDLATKVLGWSWDTETGTLRVAARPTLGIEDALVKELAGDRFEAVEGFWIARPWLLQPACPVVRASPASAETPPAGTKTEEEQTPALPRIGLAQFFSETDARTGRRSMRPYEAVKTGDPNQPIGRQGFDLVLSGRLKALPDGRVVACSSATADRPPDCVVSADFDRVWIESPESQDIIAEWSAG